MRYRAAVFSLTLILSFPIAWAQFPSTLENPRPFGSIGMRDDGSGRISGSVLGPAGKAPQDVRVEIRDEGNDHLVASAYAMPNGGFEILNVPYGLYKIVATSGLTSTEGEVDVRGMETQIALHLPTSPGQATASAGQAMVSVHQLEVPNKAKGYFNKAEQALSRNKLEQAKDFIAKALSVFPHYAQALTMRAVLALQSHQPQQAVADLQQAIDSDNNYGMAYIAMGSAFNMMSKFDDAVRALDRGLPLAPNSWQAHFELSRALLGKSDFNRSLHEADATIQLAPKDYSPVHLVRAYALVGLKNYQPAETELEHYLASNPTGKDSDAARTTLNQLRGVMPTSASK